MGIKLRSICHVYCRFSLINCYNTININKTARLFLYINKRIKWKLLATCYLSSRTISNILWGEMKSIAGKTCMGSMSF